MGEPKGDLATEVTKKKAKDIKRAVDNMLYRKPKSIDLKKKEKKPGAVDDSGMGRLQKKYQDLERVARGSN